jgi:hypothetical protein
MQRSEIATFFLGQCHGVVQLVEGKLFEGRFIRHREPTDRGLTDAEQSFVNRRIWQQALHRNRPIPTACDIPLQDARATLLADLNLDDVAGIEVPVADTGKIWRSPAAIP